MRLGVISDVHGNLVALEAVLSDMPAVEAVICVGDVVGYNPWPGECVDRVREVASVSVMGNHDRNVDTPDRYRANRMAHAGLIHAGERLDDDQAEWLRTRPERAEVANGRVLVVHSHPDPAQRGTYVYPSDFPRLRPHLDDYEGLLFGHTHVQHEATVDGRLLCNPGSVGQPRDGDPRAAYAVLHVEDDLRVELRRVSYDVERVQEAVADAGLPDRTGARLERGE